MTSIEELQAQIQVVARARVTASKAVDIKNQAYDEWLSAHGAEVEAASQLSLAKVFEEEKLRELTLAIFKETGEKHPAPEVNIREVEKLEYKPENGLYWAIQHNIALKLDTLAFEKLVKASPETFSSFVKIEKIATATIATNIPAQVEQK